jgi:hypothetical protein
MLKKKSGLITRRSLLKSSAAVSAALVSGVGGVSMFNVTGALAAMANQPMFWRGSMLESM